VPSWPAYLGLLLNGAESGKRANNFSGLKCLSADSKDCVYWGITNYRPMRAALLIFFLFIGFNITRYLVNLVKMEARGVRVYTLTSIRQISLLFYALFGAVLAGFLIFHSLTGSMREELRLGFYVLAAILILLFGLTFWLHLQYAAYQGESSLQYDPSDLEISLQSPRVRVRIRKTELARVQWVKCSWPWMIWSDYEYMVLHLHNGSRLLLTSLLLPLKDLHHLFNGKEIRIEKRFICRIKKDF
jgi:hypothetical protein